jgi:hypothetical protein
VKRSHKAVAAATRLSDAACSRWPLLLVMRSYDAPLLAVQVLAAAALVDPAPKGAFIEAGCFRL